MPLHMSSLDVFLLSTSWEVGRMEEKLGSREGESLRCTFLTSEPPFRQILLPGPLYPHKIGTLGIEVPWSHRVHTGLQLWS